MKGTRLLFAALLAPLVFHAATADDASDIVRAATRRGVTNTINTTRKKTSSKTENTAQSATGTSRAISVSVSRESDTSARTANVVSRTATHSDSRTVGTRNTGAVMPRPPKNAPATSVSRVATPATISRTATTATKNRTSSGRTSVSTPRSRVATTSRAATTDTAAIADTILNRNFGKCREVFYSCMDEFCANKDTELGRCACSSRISEFSGTKRHLSDIEDKLLNFGERLLTVNMDAEDVTAMNQATEGELAFSEEDKSASKKMLDEIAKKLNTSFNDDAFDNGLNAINLSLNVDAAFDNVDSLMGASTTTKSGTALYKAALPVCREMAAEVCSADELSIAESGYQMTIEQACTTVAKTYQTQTEQAHAKLMESSALLDISRLDIHQQRNSDDILTCRRKMLDMLTDSTVCGENMGKCLDISGRYIDPTTGAAFLTTELAQLSTLITRPSGTDTWSKIPSNAQFVTFLNSKKTFLEPAMENCQDISSYVWDAFLDDALAQIKLAQTAKLEEMRQSCTTLTTQCLDDATESIQDFDARALSIFGVSADRTVNAMCSDIKTACTALMESNESPTTTETTNDWDSGMTAIAQDKTYETILQTCREVGRNCFINTCKSTTGNFDLCTSITRSTNRKYILNGSACWGEVYNCVASAGADRVYDILTAQQRKPTSTSGDIYMKLYGYDRSQIHDLCKQNCSSSSTDCAICRLTEEIWGNCEYSSDTKKNEHNKIITMDKNATNETLLSWFAHNTDTTNHQYSCYDAATCDPGMILSNGICINASFQTSDGDYCDISDQLEIYTDEEETFTNCCSGDNTTTDYTKNCCMNGSQIKLSQGSIEEQYIGDTNQIYPTTICGNGTTHKLVAYWQDANEHHYVVCVGENADIDWGTDTDSDNITCDNGTLLEIIYDDTEQDDTLTYLPANPNGIQIYYTLETAINPTDEETCRYTGDSNSWTKYIGSNEPEDTCTPATTNFKVSYTSTTGGQ